MKTVKRIAILSSLLVAGLAASACDDGDVQEIKDCVENTLKCKDEATLLVCTNGVYVAKETCKTGDVCAVDACVDKASLECKHLEFKPTCVDNKTLKTCTNDDKISTEICAQKCADGACMLIEAGCKLATHPTKCLDANILATCNETSGKVEETTCPFGCSNAACADEVVVACEHITYVNTCIDDKTLKICTNDDKISSEICEFGCANDACAKDAEVECAHIDYVNECIDETTLRICTKNDKLSTKVCDEKCVDGACMLIEAKCKLATHPTACSSANTLAVCNEVSGIVEETVCEFNCKDGACLECAHIDYKNTCIDNKTLKICTENDKLSTKTCEFGCANGECAKDAEPECSHIGYKNTCVDAKTLKICTASDKLSTEICKFGCVDGACVVGCTVATHPTKCVDAKNLSSCNLVSGKVEESACKFGCVDGACVVGCTAITHPTKCVDENILATCNVVSGKVEESGCKFGCSANACAPKCDPKANLPVCDGKNLMTCNAVTFKMEAKDCPNGCKDGACLTTVITKDKWIGAGCYCDAGATGAKCDTMGVPIPNGKPIIGCENVSTTGFTGSEAVCLPTIKSPLAPPTYFPKGYCSLSAVGCTGGGICDSVKYGDIAKFTTCPAGSAMLTGSFKYTILLQKVTITNKTCVKNCNTDADCNMAGEMSCMTGKGAKFCYNSKNLSLVGDNYTVEVF